MYLVYRSPNGWSVCNSEFVICHNAPTMAAAKASVIEAFGADVDMSPFDDDNLSDPQTFKATLTAASQSTLASHTSQLDAMEENDTTQKLRSLLLLTHSALSDFEESNQELILLKKAEQKRIEQQERERKERERQQREAAERERAERERAELAKLDLKAKRSGDKVTVTKRGSYQAHDGRQVPCRVVVWSGPLDECPYRGLL